MLVITSIINSLFIILWNHRSTIKYYEVRCPLVCWRTTCWDREIHVLQSQKFPTSCMYQWCHILIYQIDGMSKNNIVAIRSDTNTKVHVFHHISLPDWWYSSASGSHYPGKYNYNDKIDKVWFKIHDINFCLFIVKISEIPVEVIFHSLYFLSILRLAGICL